MDPLRRDGEHDDLARLLSDLGRLEAEERKSADALADAPGLSRVETALEKAWAGSNSTRSRRWPVAAGLLAAAALVMFLVLRVVLPGKPDGPTDEFLQDGAFRIRHPASLPNSWPVRIEWSGPKGASYRVRVVEELANGEERTLLDPGAVEGFHYPLPEEETHAWPKKVRIYVELKQKDGRRQRASDSWELQR